METSKETSNLQIMDVAEATRKKTRYRTIQPDLVERLAAEALAKGRKPKDAIKEVSARLYQAGAAYFSAQPDYTAWQDGLASLLSDPHSPEIRDYCLNCMRAHASTQERLPVLEEFFQTTLASIAPVDSILDLACGLNPLALPWMPLTASARYYGCDIFSDLTQFLNRFIIHFGMAGGFETSDLTQLHFPHPAKAALLLKTLPVVEQLSKGISPQLLDAVPAEYLLISYPIRSLGGRAKGMGRTYERQFENLMKDKSWQVTRFEFKTELAFLVKK